MDNRHIGAVGGRTNFINATLTRPTESPAVAYTAGDIITNSLTASTPITFTGAMRTCGGSGYVTKVRVVTNQSTNTANYRLWLYSTTPTSIPVDNAVFTLLWANRTNRLGYVDIGPLATEQTGSDSASAMDASVRVPIHSDTESRDIYALLETKSAFTPASAQIFYIELCIEAN